LKGSVTDKLVVKLDYEPISGGDTTADTADGEEAAFGI
jgi:hypothetical protein